jgi:hypothetical protein
MLPWEIARRALTDEAAKWFARLVWSTRLVVIGVLIEGIAVIHELVGVVKQWLRRRKERADLKALREIFPVAETFIRREPEEGHTPTWVKLIAFLGLIAVAVGVAGEWKYEVKFEAATDAIQTFDSNRVAEAEKQAGDAQTSAAKIEQDNIKLQINLEQIKRTAGQRFLSSDEQNQLVKELAAYHVNRLQIWCRLNNSEAAKFGDDFETVFTRLHWNPFRRYASDSEGSVRLVGPKRIEADIAPPGLTIGVDDPAHPPEAAIALRRALRKLDLPFDARISGPWWSWGTAKPEPGFFELAIGSKE